MIGITSSMRALFINGVRVLLGLVFMLVLDVTFAASAGRAAELIMFRSKACSYCMAWDHDIGGIYHKTEEGRRAPLRMVDMGAKRPAPLATIEGLVYSPTFVLMEKGEEVGRITGYPGPDFFWPLLGKLLGKIEQRE